MPPPDEYNAERPWERQPCDDDLKWPAFQAYLALPPPRRLTELKSPHFGWSQLCTIVHDDLWKQRADAWDQHLDRIRIAAAERATAEDATARALRQGALARKLQRLGELELDKLLAIAQRPDGMPGLVPVNVMIRAIDRGIRAERLAMGDVTENVQVLGPDLSKYSVEELRQLQALQAKASEG